MRAAAFVFQLAAAIELVDEVPLRLDQRKLQLIADLGELL